MSDHKPITGELRKVMNHTEMRNVPLVELGEYEFARRCDEIDAIHAGLERENAELKAELDRVLGEQEEHAHARGESITDELREYAQDWRETPKLMEDLDAGDVDGILADFEYIADRIDAEHERQLEVLYRDMSDAEYVKLPKDADGEYIRIGDEMRGYGWPNGGVYCQAIVNEVTILVGPQDGAYRGWLMWATNECRHHHAPTVEDVTCEFLQDLSDWLGLALDIDCIKADGLFAEYAAKLQLKEEA